MCVFCVQIARFDIHSHKNLTLDFFFGRCLFMFSLEFDVINNKHNTRMCLHVCSMRPYIRYISLFGSKRKFEKWIREKKKAYTQNMTTDIPLCGGTIDYSPSLKLYTYRNGRVHWHIKQKNNLSKTTNSKA